MVFRLLSQRELIKSTPSINAGPSPCCSTVTEPSSLLNTLKLPLHPLMRRAPGLDLGLADLPQLVDGWHVTRQRALGDVGNPAKQVFSSDAVSDGERLDPDDADARVVLAAVVLSITQIAEPGLERRVVVLLDEGAVGDDLGQAADGCPLPGSVQEGNVDVGVLGELVCLVGLGVGVEEQIDTSILLPGVLARCSPNIEQ